MQRRSLWKLLERVAVEDGGPSVATGDLLVVRDDYVTVIPLAGAPDGYVLTVDSGAPGGWSPQPSAGGGGGGGDNITVNVTAATDAKFGSLPAAPAGDLLVTWQIDTSASPDAISAYVDVSALEPLLHHDQVVASTLAWGASGHTGTALSVAAFDGSGVAAVVAAVANDTILGRRSGALTFAKVSLTAEVTGVLPSANGGLCDPPPRPAYTTKVIIWAAIHAAGANTTQALGSGQTRYQPHYEEHGSTYDALCAFTSSGTGSSAVFALFANATGDVPGDLLWSSSASSTNTSNTQHIMTFAAGTWTTAGAAYKDGSDRLVLERGEKAWLASMTNGNVTWRVITGTSLRNTGMDQDVSAGGYQGFQESTTYPNFPSTAAPVTRTAQLPALGLRWVA